MAQDKIKALYDTFVKEGYEMESEAQFRKNLADPAKRKAAYDALVKDGYNMEAFDAFETNIGYGKQAEPTQAAAQSEPKPTTAPANIPSAETAAIQQTPTPAPAEKAPEQPKWQPTEQEKIRMSHTLNSMMSDFNQRSRARVEQSKRVLERNTPEGRKKEKAAKFQAQLAGTPTQVMGLTPNVSTAPANGGQGDVEDAPKPLLSGQGPVPYGVVIEDGERKTQWLLPDGSLTTDLVEADKAEYGARRVRLMNQFVGRMKENGLDPSKQEDVQRQAQLDYEAPMRKVLDQVWAQAEKEAKEADEEYAQQMKDYNSTIRSNLHALGPDGMPLPTAEENLRDYRRAVERKETFNLERMAENIYSNLPDSYRRAQLSSYTRYFSQHPEETKGKDISKAAEDALRGEVYNAVYERAVAAQLPQGKTDFLMRKLADQPLLSPYMAMDMAASSMSGSWGMSAAAQDAMARYGQEHRALDILGSIGNMAIDPTTYFAGGLGSIAGKWGMRTAGKQMLKGASKEMAERFAANSLVGRIAGGVAGGAANFATFEAMKDAQGQMKTGGAINPETGEREFSFGSVLNSGVHGALIGGATGTLSPLIGNVADKAVKATSSTAGKMGVRSAELLTSTVAEGTIFSIPDWISGEQDAFDVWTDNMAMMAGFKLSHAVKSAPSVIASLRPVNPKDGKPLTRAERIHNRKSFDERLRDGLDRGQGITNDERDELRKYGYGELSDLFTRDPKGVYEIKENGSEEYVGDVERGTSNKSNGIVKHGDIAGGRSFDAVDSEFDGYEAMERLMDDNRVSEATRAKAYYILTGRMLPMSTVTGWNQERAEDGSIIVQSLSNQGGVVTSKSFANEAAAQREIDAIMRQAELNTIDVGEQYREAEAEYYGRENVRPEAIRERVSEETGVDLDKALRKEPGKRTEHEQDAVERYARELFPEEEQYEPTPEEAEADRVYEESRQLYQRYEQGEPEAQGEIDAIALRMNEAYQLAEDAFGAESEYYMAQMGEEPWTLLNDPDLTPEQRDAVLYYINAKAALDGVLDASNEASQDKRDKVDKEIQHRTHTERGVIVPATMKADNRPTYIVKGNVAMFPDGSGVDVRNSSESIIILDEQGEYKFSSPDQILSVGEVIDPYMEFQTAYDTIDREQEEILSRVEMPYEPGSSESREASAEEAPADTDENIPAVNVEEYDRGYEEAIEEVKNLTDERLDHYVDTLREGAQKQMDERGKVDDYIRGRLEAMEYAQQVRAAESVPKTDESVPNPTENELSEGENVSETDASAENGQETALSRIPVNDDGEPIFESAPDPATAWDGLVEAAGDDAGASEIAQAQIAQATSDIEKLKKKPPTLQTPKLKGSPMAMARQRREAKETYDKAMEEYNQQIADTQGRLDAWQRILSVHTSRNAEQRRQQEEARRERDAELHDSAVAEFEEQQRIKAEKQAEQDAIGTHAVNPKIREKWESAPKAEGHEDALTLPDGSTINGRYILTEAGAASASHDINNAFAPTEGFPIDKNGQSVNDRDYAGDKDAQRIVEQMAGEYDNRALQDPVIVSKDGVVLSGNNRTMSGDLAAQQGTDTAYNEYLRKFGRKYGFTPEQVAGMKNPRVVFVPDDELPYDATTFARFNAQEKKSQSKPEAAVKLGKTVPDNIFNNIVNEISRYDRLSGFYADEKAVAQTLGALMSAGVINDKQMPELRTGTTLSAAGKELIENTLIGKVFQGNPDAVRQIIAIPTLRESVVMGLSEIANNSTLQKKGFDLSNELAKAIDLVQRAKAAQPDVYADGVPVSPFGRMQGLFDDEYGDSRVTDATTLLLADILNSGKPSELRKVLATYNSQAANSASGQMDLFTGEIPTKEEILKNVNEHFRKSTPKEQQALVEAAIAERKQRAESESETGQRGGGAPSEQTENALQRDGDREEPTSEPTAELEPLAKDPNDPNEDTPEEAALRARISIGDEWEEEGADPDKPIYKRTLYIDGKHKIIQTDAPDEKGSYMGSRLTYDGRDFGDLREIADYIDGKTTNPVGGEQHMEVEEGVAKGQRIDTNPTPAQKEAGNYKKGHVRIEGMDISIENPRNSVRSGIDADGNAWETRMAMDYGYIRGTQGKDKDHIDIFLSDVATDKAWLEEWDMDKKIYVIDQYNKDGSFDEHKVVFGVVDEKQARLCYLENYSADWAEERRIEATEVPMEDFKKWAFDGRRKIKPFAEYKAIKALTEDAGQTLTKQAYTITPTTYTNKKGKTSDVWLVKFDRDLSKEEKAALDSFSREPLTEGRKTSRGWYDRKEGGYMMRSEEAAQKLAELMENPEEISDAQPLSKEDFKEATNFQKSEISEPKTEIPTQETTNSEQKTEISSTAKKNGKATPRPKNEATLQDITEEETEQRPGENPAEAPKTEQKGQFAVSDEMREQEDELRRLLGIEDDEGDRGIYFRDEELTPAERKKRDRRIFALGVDYACNYIDNGIVAFPDFAKAIVGRLGQKVKPFIKAWYDGLRRMPDYFDIDFTAFDDVSQFDIENFDKPDYDALRDAEMRLAERKAQEASKEAEKELIEKRNEQRKENDKQREADTEALADKGASIASEAESIAENSEDRGELAGASEKIDKALDEINDQLALLGYYEADLDSPEHEVYGLRRSAEKKAVKDAVKLAKQLVDDLGIEIEKVTGKTTEQMQKSRGKNDTAVRANIAQVGGDITINLPYPDGRNLHINIGLSPTHERGVEPNRGGGAWEGDNYEVDRIMFRFGDSHNHFLSTDVTYGKMLSEIQSASRWGQPKKQDAPTSGDATQEATEAAIKVLTGGKGRKPRKKEVKAEEPIGGLFADIFDEPEKPNSNEKGTASAGSQGVADAERPDTMGKDETGTDGGKEAGGSGGNDKVGDTPAESDGLGKGTDGTPHGNDEERGLQQSAGDRGRDERGTDSGSGSAGVERGGTTGQGTISERGADESTEGLSEGEPANTIGEGSRPAAVGGKPKKPVKRYTNNFRYGEEGNEADTYTPAQRLEGNIAAIETLADVLFGNGKATDEQKQIMSRFRGWGQVDLGKFYSLDQMANRNYNPNKQLLRLAEAIKRLDPKGEKKLFEAIKRASLSAYYTPTEIAKAMNIFLSQAGFRGGQLLDPSMGNGIFEGTLRQKIQERTAITGVELDWLSGQLSRLLYPDANIIIGGFEKSGLTPGSFDVVTSNVPFGQFGVNDPSWKSDSSPIKRSAQNRIHNYYAVKMLELTRPGGLVSMMTSTAVMDTPSNQNIRAHIAEQGEIIGAIRLPDNTFQGTGATADIIFIRKWRDAEDRKKTREEGDYIERIETPFLSLHDTTAPNKVTGKPSKVRYNGLYARMPDLMIGEVRAGNQYSQEGFGLTSDLSTSDIATEVLRRIVALVGNRKGSLFNPTRTTREAQQAVREAYKGNGNWESNGNLVVQDGKVGILNAKSNEYGETTRVFEGTLKHDKMLPRVKAMIEVRTAMKKLIAAQIEGEKDSSLKALREELQNAYNNFTKSYGKLQDAANSFILDDIDGYTIQALETWKSGKFVGLSDIFTKNTIKPALRLDSANTPQEAITTSLAEYGYVRPDYMEKTIGEDWADKCADFIFKNPNSDDEYVTKDEYLSGDVVSKLAEAREAAKKDNSYDRNVKALESVQPERIPYDDIAIHLGARWIPDDILNDFMKEIFGLHATARGRHYDHELGRMVEDFKSGVRYLPDVDSFEINVEKKELGGQAQEWETPKKSAKEIFQAALEDKTIIIKWKDDDGNEHPDEEQTELANQKVADLREHFEQWLPSDPARVERLEQDYNDRFNRIVIRKFDGSHLVIPGLMGKELRPHQKDAVWMLINNRGGIVDHIVGAGKTLVMQSAIMEMRRMGIAKKPMIVALKSTVSQIAREFKEAFPSARVLAPNDKDFQKENRKKFIANISLNDYDCVVLSHEQYCMLPHTDEAERAVIDEQLWQLDNMIEYLYGQTQDQLTKRQLKALEKRRENLIARLEKRLDRSVDREFCFENLGVDYLFVDECHQFKSLPYVTSYDKIAGLGDSKGSDRAVALLTGIRHLQKMHQGDKGTIFLSGTTITNSLVEIYNLLNYLRPRELQRLGMPTFDAWASTFAVHTSELEAGTTGDFKMKDRFRSFDNVPELSQLYAEIADVRNDTNLKLPKPAVDGRTVIVPQSETMAEINREIVNMLNNKNGSYFGIHPKNPNRAPWGLHAATLSAKAAVSPRLIFPDIEDDGGKVAAVCDNVKKCYDEMSEQKGVQLIFCELGVPEKGKKYDAYTDMITRLTKDYGIPRSEIAYIQEAPTEEKRKALFQKVRDGKVRILIGGTKNMGTGVNVQDRITDMHMLTVPWTPSALEQCIGRGARQGNLVARDFMNDKVRVHYYATEGSLDLYKYQLLDAKGKMFTQFKMGTVNGGRSFDEGSADEDGNIDPAEMVAILSGNPVIFEKAKQEKAVKKLRALRNGFERDYQRKRSKYNELTARKQNLERFIRLNTADRNAVEKEGFVPDEKGIYPTTVTVRAGSAYYGENKTFDKPKEAGEYIHQLLDAKKTVWLTGFGKIAKIEQVSEDAGGLFSTYNEVRIGDGERDMLYRVRLSDDPVNAGLAFRSVLKKIVDNGKTYARELEEVNLQLNGLNLGDGVFPKQKELDEAVAKLRELTTEYNKLGKPKDTTDQSDKTKFRIVEDKETLDFLENQLQKKGYRYAQWANNGVRPPMTAKVDGEWRLPMLFGRYEQSEEGMRKANGKADLVQGNGRTTGDVAYNPYFHIRTNPLNDQFTAAYDRPELIVVEGYYPESEETSGYKADGAKNSVGLMAWHSGSVNGQLSADTKVNTMLSRYFKPSRIVPWSEVADLIMENIGEQDITFPINVVPPMLRAELAKRGARFEGVSGQVAESDIPKLKEIEEQIKKGNYEAGLERAREYADAYQSSPDAMSARVTEIADKLHTPVRIVSTTEEAKTLPTTRKQKAKGFFDPDTNEIVVVLPNNINVADVENTIVHEAVGHKGLRAMIGEDKFDRFLDEVYNHLSAPLRKIVEAMERKLYDKEVDKIFRKKQSSRTNTKEANENYYNDMAEAHIEAGRKREGFKREATEEYMADLGGRIGDKGFEKMSREELTLWGKIKAKVQQFLDKFLRGLKIAKSIRLNDKDLSYILFKSWKHQRDSGVFAKAEDVAKRHRSGYDAEDRARFRDPDMGLEETITKMKAEAMQANADNLQAKRDAMRAIGGNLNHLRSAMARQREYDITTVKSVTDLAKILMDAGLLDTPSNGELKRLLGAVNAVVGKQDTSALVRRVFDIMLHNYLGRERKTFDRLLTIKGSKVDARGVEVQGVLDPKGQMLSKEVRRLIGMKLKVNSQQDDFDELIAKAENDLGDESEIKRENAEIELEALYIARQYATDISGSKDEEAELRQCMKDAETDHKEGRMTDDAYRQYIATANEDIRANLIARAEAYESLISRLGERLTESIEEAKAWKEEAKERVNQIHHYANSDLKDIPYRTERMKPTFGSKLSNSPLVRLFMAPTATMEQVCRVIGSNSVDGNGYVKKMVVDRWQECRDKEWIGMQEAEAKMNAKAKETAGVKYWSDLYSISRKKAGTLSWRDGNDEVEHDVTQGNLMYVYMADKMNDGRRLLRHMGITDEDVANATSALDPRLREIADWVQDEFLPELRERYNETHKRMYGAPMAKIDNYVPLRVNKSTIDDKTDIADNASYDGNGLPKTITGSMIKRTRHNHPIDIIGTDGVSLILDHVRENETWNAMSEYRRDLTTLLRYNRFRNKLRHMKTIYGSGEKFDKLFFDLAMLVGGAYKPRVSNFDKIAVNITKLATGACIALRINTALKQLLSYPAFGGETASTRLISNMARPRHCLNFCLDNLPAMQRRWRERLAGNDVLREWNGDWDWTRAEWVKKLQRAGITPNAFIDLLTCCMGAEAAYQTKLKELKEAGFDKETAHRKAVIHAEQVFNLSQQSSELPYLSLLQNDRSYITTSIGNFRNSPFSYLRQSIQSKRELLNMAKHKTEMLEFEKKKGMREGLTPEQAEAYANKKYNRNWARNIIKSLDFDFVLPALWCLGITGMWYLVFGNDNEKKKDLLIDSAKRGTLGPLEGLTFGGTIPDAIYNLAKGEGLNFNEETSPAMGQLTDILNAFGRGDNIGATNHFVNFAMSAGVGINPQTLEDVVAAGMDYFGNDKKTLRDFETFAMRVISVPQSQVDMIFFDEVALTARQAGNLTADELAERYASYKLLHNEFATVWFYNDEQRKEREARHRKKAEKIMKGELDDYVSTDSVRSLIAESDEITKTEGELAKLKKARKFEEYRDGMSRLRQEHDMRRHARVKRYKHDIDLLTKQFLSPGISREESDSIVGKMIQKREALINDINNKTNRR